MLYQIVAMARNRVIGKDNRLPWSFPEDLKHFKKITMGGTVIMGRRTHESIGRALPGRENFVLSRSKRSTGEGVRFFGSLDEAIDSVVTQDAFIIGGAEVYKESIDRVDGIHLTCIDAEFEGDAFFPEIPPCFKEKSRHLLKEEPEITAVFYEKSGML